MGLLTVELTIPVDGVSGRQCQAIEGSREICLEDVEALVFLRRKQRKTMQKEKG